MSSCTGLELGLVVVTGMQNLVGCLTEDLGSLLAVGWRPLSVPCHKGISNMMAGIMENGT